MSLRQITFVQGRDEDEVTRVTMSFTMPMCRVEESGEDDIVLATKLAQSIRSKEPVQPEAGVQRLHNILGEVLNQLKHGVRELEKVPSDGASPSE